MGRRKQGASPQKDLGLIEHRKRRVSSSLPPLPLEELPPWLQEEPSEAAATKKRRKVKTNPEAPALVSVSGLGDAVLLLGTLDMAAGGGGERPEACETSVLLSSEAVPGSNSVVHTLLAGGDGDDDQVPCAILVWLLGDIFYVCTCVKDLVCVHKTGNVCVARGGWLGIASTDQGPPCHPRANTIF